MTSESLRIPFNQVFEKIRENLYFVLLEPESPGNIGAAARAIKTCGFKNLILVNPKTDLDHKETFWMAHQSENIIRSARIAANFDEVIADMRLVIATTQRKRHFKFPFYAPEEISEKINDVAVQHPVAIVFGRERTGLTNEEILKCHIHSTILTATHIPALNLAQSVMIYAHTFFRLQNIRQNRYTYDLASQRELKEFYNHLQASMKMVGFVPRDGMDSFVTRFKRLLGRSLAEKRDIRLLHKLLQIYEKKIEQLSDEKSHDLYNTNIY
jgi:tRNA (cytidine32/uridine32-2'-O)-methyltransferase